MDVQDVPGWPKGVRRITINGLGEIGVDAAGELYFGGRKLITEKRFSNFERGLAVAGLVIAGIGVAATVVQSWAAISPPQTTTNFQRCMDRHQFILGEAFNDKANRAKALDTCVGQ